MKSIAAVLLTFSGVAWYYVGYAVMPYVSPEAVLYGTGSIARFVGSHLR